MLTVLEHKSELYPPRTEQNIKLSHLTIAIAVDFSSAGEKLTKKLADKYGRPVVSISPLKPIARQADAVVRVINSIRLGLFEHVCINIAGNGIYRLTGTLSQQQCVSLLPAYLRLLQVIRS